MSGISAKLPLARDENDGIKLNKSFLEVVRQNFIMLLLTNPGERVMNSEFGIGLETFLFENDTDVLRQQIESRIRSQVATYLPYLTIQRVDFFSNRDQPSSIERNFMNLRIIYQINPLNFVDNLAISPNFETNLLNIQSVYEGEIQNLL